MINLLHETLEILEDNGKSFAEIQWVGTSASIVRNRKVDFTEEDLMILLELTKYLCER